MSKFRINPAELSPSVLCYPFPEVRQTLENLWLPEEFHLSTNSPQEAQDMLNIGGFPKIELPETSNSTVDYENIQNPIIDKITDKYQDKLPGLEDFQNKYIMPGSSRSIQLMMSEWFANGTMAELAVIDNEYDGYKWNADVLGMPVHTVNSLEEAGRPKKGRVWWLSNPSATDGNWHDQEILKNFIAQGHEIVIDAAYCGLESKLDPVDISAPNIKAVLTSPSKIFGVFRHRLSGVTYTREPVAALLDSNYWFKDVPAMFTSLALYDKFQPFELPRLYKGKQQIICRALGEITSSEFKASDTLLMAYSDEPLATEFSPLTLKSGRSRIRLSTLFERLEKSVDNSWLQIIE